MPSSLVEKTATYVRQKLMNEPSGHDWWHVARVWQWAKRLQAAEGGEMELIELSALLHNLGDHMDYKFNAEHRSLILYGMMDILEIEEPLKSSILKIVDEMKYAGDETKRPSTVEGKIVQDANFLDTLGAIGIARQFASGGFHGRAIFDPFVRAREHLNRYEYQFQKKKSTSLNGFYEKVLRVAKNMNTPTARAIAMDKVKYIELYIEQFMREWKETLG